jgi:nucleotide-binding universal stress UspA family protein
MALTRHVVVPVDFSTLSLEALRGLRALGTPVQQVTLLHVFDPESADDLATPDLAPPSKHAPEKLKRALHERLDQWREQHLQGFDAVNAEVLTGDSPADAICQRAKEIGATLIAITTHGRTGLSHLLMGSVAEGVVQKAPCPTLVMRRT